MPLIRILLVKVKILCIYCITRLGEKERWCIRKRFVLTVFIYACMMLFIHSKAMYVLLCWRYCINVIISFFSSWKVDVDLVKTKSLGVFSKLVWQLKFFYKDTSINHVKSLRYSDKIISKRGPWVTSLTWENSSNQ